MYKSPILWSMVLLLLTGFVTAFAPLKRTLGSNARIVYLHSAWVWVRLVLFAAPSLSDPQQLCNQHTNLLWLDLDLAPVNGNSDYTGTAQTGTMTLTQDI
jgi:ABC-type transport system involved in cytochrome c biogenesis permease subunit